MGKILDVVFIVIEWWSHNIGQLKVRRWKLTFPTLQK